MAQHTLFALGLGFWEGKNMQVFIRKLTLVILDALLLTLALYLAIATKFGINLNFYYINISQKVYKNNISKEQVFP
jgi:hypothetical protein